MHKLCTSLARSPQSRIQCPADWLLRLSRSFFSVVCLLLLGIGLPVHAATLYVDLNSPLPSPPYTNWAGAAANIQDAVDAAATGDLILVTNGVYQTGARNVYGTSWGTSNRVAVTNAMTVQSVNGPGVTVIQGYQVPGTTNGAAAIRCAFLTNGPVLSGFTLTNGATQTTGDGSGGGVWCASISAMVTNCVLAGNSANMAGGGAVNGTLNNCTLSGNSAQLGGGIDFGALSGCTLTGNRASGLGGGANSSTLNGCTLTTNSAFSGGGAYSGTLSNCTLSGNSVFLAGGGAESSTLNNCFLTGNSAQYYGGGADSGTLNNCTLSGNSSSQVGGGACSSTLNNCLLTGNSAQYYGGGAYSNTLNNCVLTGNSARYGGGAYSNTLNNCTLSGNSASQSGGGAYSSTLNNCLLTGNSAKYYGGGAYSGTLNNCTLSGNWTSQSGGGAYSGTLNNCIAYYSGGGNYLGSTLNFCCTTPLPARGTGNITNAPLFVNTNGWSNLRLQATSPCINAGKNSLVSWATDLDGNPRIVGGTVDIGAYEYQSPSSRISYAWLQQYGLPTDGSADYVDPDHDGMNNWQEWAAGTDPTNANSVLRMVSVTNGSSGAVVSWLSVTNHTYSLEWATNPAQNPAFSLAQSNIAGQASITTLTDTNATGGGPFFYRVRAE
jgi:hypothetical protein